MESSRRQIISPPHLRSSFRKEESRRLVELVANSTQGWCYPHDRQHGVFANLRIAQTIEEMSDQKGPVNYLLLDRAWATGLRPLPREQPYKISVVSRTIRFKHAISLKQDKQSFGEKCSPATARLTFT